MRGRKPQKVTLGEIVVVAGKLIFLLMSSFNQMAGTATLFQWLADHCAYTRAAINDRLDDRQAPFAATKGLTSLTTPPTA